MTTVHFQRIGNTKDLLGESPCWESGVDEAPDSLYWIDSLAGTLWQLHPASGLTVAHRLPPPVGSIAPGAGGILVVALRNSFARYDPQTRALKHLGRIDIDHPDVRLNDGKCDVYGNFIVGTMHINRKPGEPILGGLYRLRPEGTVERIGAALALANGPCFSLDGRTLYVADTPARTIWAFDYTPDAPLTRQRVFVRTDEFNSGSDGATLDAEGFIWTVLPRAAKLARFAPDGTLDQLVEVPCTYPTSLCFGGPAFRRAWVTSISKSTHLTGTLPQDGGVFEVSGLPAGLAPKRFAQAAG